MMTELFMLIVSGLVIFLLFVLGQNDKRKWLFYSIVWFPFLIVGLWMLLISPLGSIALLVSLPLGLKLILGAIIIERIGWGITLREISGEDRLVWFYIAATVPLFGWLLYRVVRLA